MKMIYTVLVVLILGCITVTAQDITGMQSLDDLAGEDFANLGMQLSPDGTMIVSMQQGGLCLYYFADASIECVDFDEDAQAVDGTPRMRWSPDSQYIALVEDTFRRFHESDIWVFNVQTMALTNLTDDGIGGSLMRMMRSDSSETPLLDFLPIWHPVTGDLYFFRYIRDESVPESEMRLELHRIDHTVETPEPELVSDLTGRFSRFSVYEYFDNQLDGFAAISPDGTKLAFNVAGNRRDDIMNGIWVLDLENPDNAPAPVAPSMLMQTGLPNDLDIASRPAFVVGLGWTADSAGLFVLSMFDPTAPAGTQVYFVDVSGRTITPLTDFSKYALREFSGATDENGQLVVGRVPRTAAIAGNDLLMLSWEMPLGDRGGLVRMDRTGQMSELYMVEDYRPAGSPVQPSVSSDGKVLMMGYLFTP